MVLEKHAHFQEGRLRDGKKLATFLMYYSNKRLKPTTACTILRRNLSHGTRKEQINRRFIDAMFVFCNLSARATSNQHERTQKKLCSATLRDEPELNILVLHSER